MARAYGELTLARRPGVSFILGVGLSLLAIGCTSDEPARSVAPGPAHGEVEDIEPIEWNRVDVGADDMTLTVEYDAGSSACFGIDHADVEYREDRIVVTLYEGTKPGTDLCQPVLLTGRLTVPLDQPVSGRDIVDGAA